MNEIKAMLTGFAAGAIAILTVVEILDAIFASPSLWTGWDRSNWDFGLNDYGVPRLLMSALWGGLWGALFPIVFGTMPKGPLTLKGLLYGLIGPALIGVLIAIPLVTQNVRVPLFFDGDSGRVIPTLVILAGFGAALGWLYGLFAYKHLPGFED